MKVFFVYSHEDEILRNELERHLASLKREHHIETWHDRRITPGSDWGREILHELNLADVVLLLVSADFLASDYCYGIEMKRALERHEAREAKVVPVIVRECAWEDAPFAKIQALPKDARPVTSWENRDEAWTSVSRGIRATVLELLQTPETAASSESVRQVALDRNGFAVSGSSNSSEIQERNRGGRSLRKLRRKSGSYGTKDFLRGDNDRGLFPLRTTAVATLLAEDVIREYIYSDILNSGNSEISFDQASVGYALKDPIHLRRVLALDPFAAYFIYDFILQKRDYFGPAAPGSRQRFGYNFVSGYPTIPSQDYSEFRQRKYALKEQFKYFAKVDIANCFSSFYHSNVVNYVKREMNGDAASWLSQFLQEINGGTLIDCFPQGIFPAKALGNRYLSFSEDSAGLESSGIIRFLDDYYFFADSSKILRRDLLRLQEILGEHSLSLNLSKTQLEPRESHFDEWKLDDIKKSLLKKRKDVLGYDEDENEVEVVLDEQEREYLKSLIRQTAVAEEDVELALSLLREDPEESLRLAELVLEQYPHLIKSLYRQIDELPEEAEAWIAIRNALDNQDLDEFQLFWLIRIMLDSWEFDEESARFLFRALEHPACGVLAEAAVLECEYLDHGLFELKKRGIREVRSSLGVYACLVGLLGHEKAQRNQIYRSVARSSPAINVLVRRFSQVSPEEASKLFF